jgi:hypothetical protein
MLKTAQVNSNSCGQDPFLYFDLPFKAHVMISSKLKIPIIFQQSVFIAFAWFSQETIGLVLKQSQQIGLDNGNALCFLRLRNCN